MENLRSTKLLLNLRRAVRLTALVLLASGCGGNSSSTVHSIAFLSTAALDGSNAANTNNTANIWLAKSDGSALAPLTTLVAAGSADYSLSLAWSPDGTRLAFSSARALDGSDAINAPFGTHNVWLINADGSGATPLTHKQSADAVGPIWSPDGTKLIFGSNGALDGSDSVNSNLVYNLWVVNADGSNATPVTKLTAANTGSFGVSWSPDGKKLAFLSNGALDGRDAMNPATNIWTSNVDGSNPVPLTKLTTSNVDAFDLSWAPQTNRLAFQSNRALDGGDTVIPGFVSNVWVIDADGSGLTPLTRLTTPGMFAGIPSWSPEGRRLAYVSNRALDGGDTLNGSTNLWLMYADGSSTLPLTRLRSANPAIFPPIWSSDGAQIALTSDRALDGSDALNPLRDLNVWLVNVNGSGAIPLTTFTSNDVGSAGPAWRP